MTINTTNKMLYSYFSELAQIQTSVLGILFRTRISDFHELNFSKYVALGKTLNDLQKEYFVLENDKIVTITDDKGVTTSKLNEGKVFEDYQTKYNEIMNTSVVIRI